MPNKKQVLELIRDDPVEIGHWCGFNDLTQLHNEWLKMFLFSDDDLTLQGHRGSYKTTTLSLFFAIHAIIRPNESLMYFRKTESDVAEICRQATRILESGCIRMIVQILYGIELKLIRASTSEIQTNLSTKMQGSNQIIGLGIGTSITGKHADIVVTDDIVNVNDRISTAERERTKIAYMELQNIKNRGGRFINTGTPWHKDDAFALMAEPKKYDCYSTGLMTDEMIQNLKDRMSPSLFSANYELRHIAAENIIFTEPTQGASHMHVANAIAHLDSAFYGEDYTAFTIMDYHDGHFYVYGRMWRKHVEDCYNKIIELYNYFRCSKLYNEKNADKGLVARDLKNKGLRTVSYDEYMNKHIKIVTYLKGIWKDVIFVEGTDPDYIEQICDYTEDAAHDDAPDSAACLARLLYKKANRKEYNSIFESNENFKKSKEYIAVFGK